MNLNLLSKYRGELFGVAIISILVFHYCDGYFNALADNLFVADRGGFLHRFVSFYNKVICSIGVEVFLILSGIGLYYSASSNYNAKSFYRKRLLRIMPAYIIVGGAFWIAKDLVVNHLGLREFILDFSFISFFTQGSITIWFIGLILFLYLIYPAIYKYIFSSETARGRFMAFLSLLIFFLGVPVFIYLLYPNLYSNIQIAITRIPIFIFGCYIGKSTKEGEYIRPRTIAFVIVLIMANRLLFMHLYNGAKSGIIYRYEDLVYSIAVLLTLTLVIHALRNIRRLMIFLKTVGNYSLELYVSHITLRNLMGDLELRPYLPVNYLIMVCLAVTLSIGVKALTDRLPA